MDKDSQQIELSADTRLREHLYEQALAKSDFCDVTLEFGPPNKMKQMGAHWCVLVHCPFFDYIYRFYGKKQDTVRVYDEHTEAIETAIKYLYTGKVSLHIDTVGDVLCIGRYFQMSVLLNECARVLSNLKRCEHNCVKILLIARQFQLPMYNDIVAYINNNLISVIEYPPNCESITATIIEELIKHTSVRVIRPTVLCNFFRKWRDYDERNRHQEYQKCMSWLASVTTLSIVPNKSTGLETLEVLMVIANKPRGVYAYVVEEDRWKFVTKLPPALNQSIFWSEETTVLAVDSVGKCFYALKNEFTKPYNSNNIFMRIHKFNVDNESWSAHVTLVAVNDLTISEIQVNNAICIQGRLYLVVTTLNVISQPKRVLLLTLNEETGMFTKSFLFKLNPRTTVLEDVKSCISNKKDICVTCSLINGSAREIKLVVIDVHSKEIKLLRPVRKEVFGGNNFKMLTFPAHDGVIISALDSSCYTIVNVTTGTLVNINDMVFYEPKQALSIQTDCCICGNVENSVFVLDIESNRGFQFFHGTKTWFRIPPIEYRLGSGTIVHAILPSTLLQKLFKGLKCECKL